MAASEAATAPDRMAGRYFGAAARFDQIESEPGLADLIRSHCQWVTPEIHLKWDALEWYEGRHDFAQADGLIRFAARHGLSVRGHTLIWDQSTPAWAKNRLRREKDWTLVRRHFETVLGRYAGQVREWDVVNEPIDSEQSDGMRRTVFHRAFGPDYVAAALAEARAFAPAARLAINDYGFDYENPVEQARRDHLLRLLDRLKADGAPLDSVGIQAHLDLGKGPIDQASLARFFADIAAFGLDIVITELDVKEHERGLPLDARDARVAAEAGAYLDVALDQPAVKGVITWGMSDRHSWLQDQLPGGRPRRAELLNRGLPFDAALRPKPMFESIRAALARGPA